jgi:hypothetical protein
VEYHYYFGLGFIAKTDVHLAFEPQACLAFYTALRAAMQADENAKADKLPGRIQTWIDTQWPKLTDRDAIVQLGETLFAGERPAKPPPLSDVALLKVLCDVYFLTTFKRLEPDRFEGSEARQDLTATAGSALVRLPRMRGSFHRLPL